MKYIFLMEEISSVVNALDTHAEISTLGPAAGLKNIPRRVSVSVHMKRVEAVSSLIKNSGTIGFSC